MAKRRKKSTRTRALPKSGRSARLILVTRDVQLVQQIEGLFPTGAVQVTREPSIDRVVERFESQAYDILIVTSAAVKAGEIDGVELLEVIGAQSPNTQVVFIVEPRDISIAMSALKAGAYQYAKMPATDKELRLLIETSLKMHPELEPGPSAAETKAPQPPPRMVGRSRAMQAVYRQIRQAAATDIPVLILGETGTGKDLVAHAIHAQSDRSEGSFVPVHLGALPPELVASELFGHEKGAFTGANLRRIGRFELARGGTVFLDEIGTVDERVQVGLLRLIERKKFHRLGGCRAISSNARIVAASNRDLADDVQTGVFREDLYYRLDVFRIEIPPVRERQGDIALLIDEFLSRYNVAFEKHVAGISPECVSRLERYDWPGNVRELKNVIQRAVLVCTGEVLLPEYLPPRFRPDKPARPRVTFDVGTPLAEVEREMIVQALRVTKNNRKRAADLLGISRRSLYNRLRKYDIR